MLTSEFWATDLTTYRHTNQLVRTPSRLTIQNTHCLHW